MTLILIILLVSLVLALIAYYLCTKNNVKYMKTIPSPPSNSWFGNAGEFLQIPIEKYLEKFTDMMKHGSLVQFKVGLFSPLLLVTDQKFTKYVLSSTKHINKSDQYKYFHNWLGNGIFTADGDKWKKTRREYSTMFNIHLKDSFVEIFERNGEILIEKLDKLVGKDSFDIHDIIHLYSLDVILEATTGKSIDAQNNENCNYVQMTKVICNVVNRKMLWPMPDFLYALTSLYYKEKEALKVVKAFADNVINLKLKESKSIANNSTVENEKKNKCILDFFLDSEKHGNVCKENVRDQINATIFGGHDTTATAISFTLYALANHPEIQDKVLEEQKLIFGDIKNVVDPGSLLHEMKYLELVVKEALRMYGTAYIIGRKLNEDFEFEGNVFPKGLNCGFLLYCIHRNPENFPEPAKFKPERFLEEESNSSLVFMPFSAGPRSCIGQKIAWPEMKSAISKIIRNFELLPANPNPPLQLTPAIVIISKNGVNISIKRRG